MNKRLLLVSVLVLIGGLLFAGGQGESGGAEQMEQYTIRLAHIDPVTHPHNLASERLAELVADRTDGNVTIEVYPAGQLGNAPNLMEQVQLGTIEMFQGGIGWWGSSVPDYWLVASNFVFDNLEHSRAVMTGPIGDGLVDQLQDTVGVRVLTQGMIRNPRNLAATRPVRSLEDLQGLKVRVPEMPNWMVPWEALGANPTPMPLTETYLGLQQGVVEGVEHGYPQLYLNNYTEVAKYVTNTEHQYEMAGFFIQEDFFQSLSAEYQEILLNAAQEAEEYNNELQIDYREQSRQDMLDQGVEFIDIDTGPWYEVGRDIMRNQVVPTLGITEGLLEEIWAYDY